MMIAQTARTSMLVLLAATALTAGAVPATAVGAVPGVGFRRKEVVMPVCMAFVVAPHLASDRELAAQLDENQANEER